ncbi:type II secretion system F family protein [Nocardioides daejeonensis]|uniref:type II secretion system F family protein n=1 Tax=Nocardioides daejeonensis TaxID=1046556 RepID=UPI000D7471F1|nr:type II secretion system F family protein [Nocardioides daejeonensis]
MGAAVGLVAGAGLLLIWLSCSVPRSSRSAGPRPSRTADLLARAGLGRFSPRALGCACLVLALLAFVVMLAVTSTPPVAAVFAAIAGSLPVALVSGRARRRQREFAQVWPEVVDSLASGVRAGLSLPESLAALADRGPESLRPVFAGFARHYQTTGRFDVALDALKEQLSDPVGDRVVEGLRVARAVGGGDLGRLLRNLSGHLRDDERIRAELESRQAWAVNAARLAVSAPWAILLMMSAQTDAVRAFGTPGGAVVLLLAAGCCVVAYAVMMRIGRLPAERRVLG